MNEFDDYKGGSNGGSGSNGLAIASMVLGIVSIVLCCIWYLSIIAGIVALILGILHNKNNGKNGMSTAGIVCGVIGIILAVVFFIIGMLGLAMLGGMSGLESYLQ